MASGLSTVEQFSRTPNSTGARQSDRRHPGGHSRELDCEKR